MNGGVTKGEQGRWMNGVDAWMDGETIWNRWGLDVYTAWRADDI
jgi:hypothetical protein